MTLLLARYWHFAAIGMLVALLTGASWHIGNLNDDLAASRSAHKADVAFWKQAGVLAVTRAKDEKRRIEAEQDAITQRIDNETRTELDGVRAKYNRLLSTRADRGSTAAPNLPFNLDCLGITPDASICDRLLAYRDEAGRLAEQAELNTKQLNKLIDAYAAQAAIDRGGHD